MKFKRSVKSVLAVCVMVMVFSVVVMAASESLDGSRCTWYGGIDDEDVIYSKVWDHIVDGTRYTVTVWAMDDNGDKDSRTGTTNGVDADGEVIVTKDATYDHLITPNKCGYKEFSPVY